MHELERLSVSTLNWLFHHGDSVVKKAANKAIKNKGKGTYQRIRR